MDAEVEEQTAMSAEVQAARRATRLRWALMGGGVVLALVAGLWYYLASGRYVSTDDSSIQAAQATISANVPGRVVALEVRDNQSVHRGDVLFRLDDRAFRIAVEEAQAKLASARMQIGAAKATYRHQLADLAAARDTLAYQQHEYERQQRLLQSGISSRAQFEQVQHSVELARSQLNSAQQQAGSVLALLGGNPDLPLDAHPVVMQAQAALDRANLDLSYTVVRAPDDGVVDRVEQLQVGDYINAATAVFGLISSGDIWVEANFKEDDLTYMRAGQSAEVSIDDRQAKSRRIVPAATPSLRRLVSKSERLDRVILSSVSPAKCGAKFFKLTRAGRKQLDRETQDWEQATAILARFLSPAEEA